MDLSELKLNRDYLLAALGVEADGKGLARCPFHEDKTASLHVFRTGRTEGAWLWKCHTGCGSGTLIDAAMMRWNLSTPGQALRRLETELGVKIFEDEEVDTPVIDQDKASALIAHAQKLLQEDKSLEQYWRKKRGFQSLDALLCLGVGFIKEARFEAWPNLRITGWVLPITDRRGDVAAVKIHCEVRPWPDGPKSLWAPLGLTPAAKPRHGFSTLWPRPESFHSVKELVDTQEADEIFLCTGELKALVMIAEAEVCATSITTGESGAPHKRLLERIKRNAKRVRVVYDNDKAGLKWLDATMLECERMQLKAEKFTFKKQAT